ncbi:MAG: hypothetical protein HND53_01830 [Proteobacteria bacterium]|nr:hypothetical protein [Pseudomonadota bacterium]
MHSSALLLLNPFKLAEVSAASSYVHFKRFSAVVGFTTVSTSFKTL